MSQSGVDGDQRPASLALRLGWLAVMGAVFFSTYGLANGLAAQRAAVPSFAFAWERAIPFVPWTIVPYWSIDFLYAFSFLLFKRRADLRDHVKRLLTVQFISVACFLLWPLRFSFERPATEGVAGALFTLLMGFDKPYNQAPSLHIGLLVVLWAVYLRQTARPAARLLLHLWFAAIGISVLTTYQHHVIDVPTGAAVGCLALFLFPLRRRTGTDFPEQANEADAVQQDADDRPSPLVGEGKRERGVLARRYVLAALALAAVTLALIPAAVGWALLTGWIALALACVAIIYWRNAPDAFQKNAAGRLPASMLWLLAPTIVGAFLNSRAWTWRQPAPVTLAARLSIGRAPTTSDMRQNRFTALLDLTAEMPRWAALDGAFAYAASPQLDLLAPSVAQLDHAVAALDRLHGAGRKVLVCCALGYGRSALCAAAWLARQRGEHNAAAAFAAVRERQPNAVAAAASLAVLQAWLDQQAAQPKAAP
ncbi:MAG: dual specificity protein phosphatase family protein [Azonexus sp.]|jgi:membrane-associated phospholipid phosphatase|nr:dual specificity protein phosphatase family protein [Azonexus sp.]